MNLLTDVLTYMRRIIKVFSNTSITDTLLIDYLNRFVTQEVDARIQLFDLKTNYQFETVPGRDRYNMPLYDVQTVDNENINFYPVYQGFMAPVYVDGVEVPFHTDKMLFNRLFPTLVQRHEALAQGDGMTTNFDVQIPQIGANSTPINNPINTLIRGHVDMTGVISTGMNQSPPLVSDLNENIPVANVYPEVYFTSSAVDTRKPLVISDSGQYLNSNVDYGLLMKPGNAPLGNSALGGGYSTSLNTINYLTGAANLTFDAPPGDGVNIDAQVRWLQTGRPTCFFFNNNIITLRTVPDRQYLIEVDAYLTPAAYLATTDAIQFGYMSEYFARGAARKILSDTGDTEQFQINEPLFREQELLVVKRSARQVTSTRTPTIYSVGKMQGYQGYNQSGGGY